LTDNYNMYRVT